MNEIDRIIQNRKQLMTLVAKHGVISLKLYGSVLARTETEQSDIDFLAVFDPSLEYDWEARFRVQEELETYLGRRIGIVDSRKIPDVFKPAIGIDPIDIMDLSHDKQYSVTPKTSKLYYIMLDRMFHQYNVLEDNEEIVYMIISEKVSWWFSRLLRLTDNDLKDYEGFNYVEVLHLCEKLSPFWNEEYTSRDLERFKTSLKEIRKYVKLKLKEWET